MTLVRLVGVHVDASTNQPVILLAETEGSRQLPIFIGAPEAASIVYALQGMETPRPLTHDFIATLLGDLHVRLQSVNIDRVERGTFYAQLTFLDANGSTLSISARPSDGIALAVRMPEVSLQVDEEVFREAGITVEEIPGPPSEEELQQFREFLAEVQPEDFIEEL
ncbi:MAG: bifunctional nuclease family protein [Acidimicrobiia bacterium]